MFLFEQDFNFMVPKKKPKKKKMLTCNKLLLHVYYMTRQIRII